MQSRTSSRTSNHHEVAEEVREDEVTEAIEAEVVGGVDVVEAGGEEVEPWTEVRLPLIRDPRLRLATDRPQDPSQHSSIVLPQSHSK